MTSGLLDELRDAGLVDATGDPRLTLKGRDWLIALEDVDLHDSDEGRPSAAELILSTSGLFR